MNFHQPVIPSSTVHPLVPVALAIALALPCIAQAMSVGEIALQSKLGQPLLAQVDFKSEINENIANNCLSLTTPDPREEDARNYLTKAKLSIQMEGSRQYVLISTYQPFNEPFAKLRLQIKCPGMGSVVKTLTILPDIDEPIFQSLTTTFDLPVIADSTPTSLNTPATTRPATSTENQAVDLPLPRRSNRRRGHAQPSAEYRQVTGQAISGKAEQSINEHRSHEHRRAPAPRHVHGNAKQNEPSTFRLKLSGEPFDESRIGKITPQEREILLARQKLLDADDQTASFLTLQHQVKQLQDELGEIKQKLVAVPAASTGSTSQLAIVEPQATTQTTTQTEVVQRRSLIIAGVLAAMLALLLVLRHFTKSKSRQTAAPVMKQPTITLDDIPRTSGAAPAIFPQIKSAATTAALAPQLGDSAPRLPPQNDETDLNEDDTVLEEAELYAEHGHPDKAITLLKAEIAQHPDHAEAWVLLLSIFSSLGKASEFEQTAQNFISNNKESASWSNIQALGRTLAPDNPLYISDDSLGSVATPQAMPKKHRPIGDVLVEMGVLSELDLRDCLTEFDSKVHGRFGGYLISRRMITLAQLNDALLYQQSNTATAEASQPVDTSPAADPAQDHPLDLDFAPAAAEIKPLDIEFSSSEENLQAHDPDFEPPAATTQTMDSHTEPADLAQNEPLTSHNKVQHKN